MEGALFAFLAVSLLLVVLGVALLLRQAGRDRSSEFAGFRQALEQQASGLRQEVQGTISQFREEVSTRLGGMSEEVGKRLEVFGEVRQNLGQLSEATKEVQKLGQALGTGIDSLQSLLQPPKLRGELGEQMLELVLSQTLPAGAYVANHRFSDGTHVEFAIKTGLGMVAVDAKFPLEAFQRWTSASSDEERQRAERELDRTVRAKAVEVANYIKPDEGTLDFALMYIPADGVYYAVFGSGNDTLWQYCAQRHVFPTSPSLLYPLLAAIALGLKGLQVEREAQQILAGLSRLERDFGHVQERFRLAGTQLSYAKSNFDAAGTSLDDFRAKLSAMTQASREEEIEGSVAVVLPQPEDEPSE